MVYNNYISSFSGVLHRECFDPGIDGFWLAFELAVRRSSGYEDIIEILVPHEIEMPAVYVGDSLRITGFLYSYIKEGTYPKTHICIYANSIIPLQVRSDRNVVVCKGTVVKTPILRNTPRGRVIGDVLVAVNNTLFDSNKPTAAYIPTIMWNELATQYKDTAPGTTIYIVGKLQSRLYNKNINGQMKVFTAHELSVNSCERCEEEKHEQID